MAEQQLLQSKHDLDKKYAIIEKNLNRYSKSFLKKIKQIRKCIKLNNNNPYFYEIMGQIFFEQGDFNSAIKSFTQAIKLNPREKSFELFLAKSLYHSKTNLNYKKSIYLLDKYIKNDDFPIDAWDAGNGVAGELMSQIAKKINTQNFLLYENIDGNFPNHHPDPSDPKNLEDCINLIKKKKLDCGINR